MYTLWLKLKRRLILGAKTPKLVDLRHIDDVSYFVKNRLLFSHSMPIVNLGIDSGVTLPAFRLTGKGCHPFVSALKALDNQDQFVSQLSYIKTAMDRFYSNYQPSNAFDILGLEGHYDHTLKSLEPYVLTLPWDEATPKKEQRAKRKSIREENRVLNVNLGADDGWAWSGPVSDEKLDIEARRLLGVYTSIVQNGYNRNNGPDGDIRVNVLFDELLNTATWQSRVGQHRVIALSSLGFEKIPCRVSKFVSRSEVDAWPNVRNGLYSTDIALLIFDHMFSLGQRQAS
jgi:hypothetical protein